MRTRLSCPSCGNSLQPGPPKFRGGLNSSSSPDEIRDNWIGVGKSNHFDYFMCRTCGTLASLCYPEESHLSELYNAMPPNMEEAVDEEDQFRNQYMYANRICKAMRSSSGDVTEIQMLEVGADRGMLVAALANVLRHNLYRAVAIEPNNEVLTVLSSTLSQCASYSQVYTSMDQMFQYEPNHHEGFDLIAVIHVLDHAYDPSSMLQDLGKLLNDDGFIFVVVHHPHSTVARLLGSKWPAFCAQHPQVFTPLGIQKLAQRNGLKVALQGRTVNHFSLSMLTNFLGLDVPMAKHIKLKAPLGNRYYFLQKA